MQDRVYRGDSGEGICVAHRWWFSNEKGRPLDGSLCLPLMSDKSQTSSSAPRRFAAQRNQAACVHSSARLASRPNWLTTFARRSQFAITMRYTAVFAAVEAVHALIVTPTLIAPTSSRSAPAIRMEGVTTGEVHGENGAYVSIISPPVTRVPRTLTRCRPNAGGRLLGAARGMRLQVQHRWRIQRTHGARGQSTVDDSLLCR